MVDQWKKSRSNNIKTQQTQRLEVKKPWNLKSLELQIKHCCSSIKMFLKNVENIRFGNQEKWNHIGSSHSQSWSLFFWNPTSFRSAQSHQGALHVGDAWSRGWDQGSESYYQRMHLGSKWQLQLVPHDCQLNRCQTKNTDGPPFCWQPRRNVSRWTRLAVSDPCDRWPSIDVQVRMGPLYYVKCWLCSNGFNICSDYTFVDLKHSVSTNSTDTIHAGTAEMTPLTACIDHWCLQLRMLVHF